MLKAPTLNKQIKKSKLLSFISLKTADTVSKNLFELTNLFVLLKKISIFFRFYFDSISFSYYYSQLLLLQFKKQYISKESEINQFTFRLNR